MKKTHFLILAGSVFCQKMTKAVNRSAVNRLSHFFGKIHFLLISENEFFQEIKRDGITIFHGIHAQVLETLP